MKGKSTEKSLLTGSRWEAKYFNTPDINYICQGCEEMMEVSWKMALEQMG